MKHFKTLTLLKTTSKLKEEKLYQKKKKKADHTKFYPSHKSTKDLDKLNLIKMKYLLTCSSTKTHIQI